MAFEVLRPKACGFFDILPLQEVCHNLSPRLHDSLLAEGRILQATVGQGRLKANLTAEMLRVAGDLLRILCNGILISGNEAILSVPSIANYQYLGFSGQMKQFDEVG